MIGVMDAGAVAWLGAGAALAGAALGAGGALGAAYLSGRSQARSAHVQWRRQVRREAYAEFLAAAMEHHNVTQETHHLVRRDRQARDQIRETSRRGRELLGVLDRRGAVVDVEGPDLVAAAALRVLDSEREWAATVLGTWCVTHPNRLFRDHFPPDEQRANALEALRVFRRLARTALDDPGGALEPRR